MVEKGGGGADLLRAPMVASREPGHVDAHIFEIGPKQPQRSTRGNLEMVNDGWLAWPGRQLTPMIRYLGQGTFALKARV